MSEENGRNWHPDIKEIWDTETSRILLSSYENNTNIMTEYQGSLNLSGVTYTYFAIGI